MATGGAKTAVIDLESKLLNSKFRSSSDFLEKILHDDFLEIGASGRTYNKEQTIDLMTGEPEFSALATDFRFSQIAEDVALLTYTLEIISPNYGTRHSIRSSVWKLENGNWQLAFHQGTQTGAFNEPSR